MWKTVKTLVIMIIIRTVMPISLKVYAFVWEIFVSWLLDTNHSIIPFVCPKPSSKHLLRNDFPKNLVVKLGDLGITLECLSGFRKILI